MKPFKQRRISRPHGAVVVVPKLEEELREVLKHLGWSLALSSSCWSSTEEEDANDGPPTACSIPALKRLWKILQQSNSTLLFLDQELVGDSLWKQVHGLLMLLLGCSLTSTSFCEKRLPFQALVCQCLEEFHQIPKCQAILNSEELVEVYSVFVRATIILNKSEEKKVEDHPVLADPLTATCLFVLQHVSLRITTNLPKEASRQLVLFLVRGCSDESHQSLQLLQALKKHPCPHTSVCARTALHTVKGGFEHSTGCESELSHLIFSWSCLAQDIKGTTKLLQSKNVLGRLVDLALQDGLDPSLAIQAADCLSHVARNSPSDTQLLSILVQVLVGGVWSVRTRVLPGLCHIHARDGLIQTFSWNDTKRLQRTISSLVQVLLAKRENTATFQVHDVQGVISILLDCMRLDTQRETLVPCIPPSEWASICIVLLKSETELVIRHVAGKLCEILQEDGARVMEQTPELLSGLAEVLASPFSTAATKESIICSFYDLTVAHGEAPIVLARQPKVLASITFVAADESDTTAKRTALSTLIILSKNVRNRRILARQVGVLACLIRHAREYEPLGSNRDVFIERATLKEHIVQLAEAL